ncbi:MAG: hypothetical protein HY698_14010 [Deltaproteobacteria bacterium]|nr:hypothetical protein [Deltaproteobacteria bacterium]
MRGIHPWLFPCAFLLFSEAAISAPRDFVGSAACGACHPVIFRSWQATAHARASSPEVLGAWVMDGACLSCHATGDAISARAKLPGVQCEACHGGGAAYMAEDIMRDRALARLLGLRDLENPSAACGRCHRSGTSPVPFEYPTAWAKIAH